VGIWYKHLVRKIKWSLNVTKLRPSPLPHGLSQGQYTEELLLLHVLYIRAYLDILSNNFWIITDRLYEEHLEYQHKVTQYPQFMSHNYSMNVTYSAQL